MCPERRRQRLIFLLSEAVSALTPTKPRLHAQQLFARFLSVLTVVRIEARDESWRIWTVKQTERLAGPNVLLLCDR